MLNPKGTGRRMICSKKLLSVSKSTTEVGPEAKVWPIQIRSRRGRRRVDGVIFMGLLTMCQFIGEKRRAKVRKEGEREGSAEVVKIKR